MRSSNFSGSELLDDDSSSELLFEDLLEDDFPSIPRSFPWSSASTSMESLFLGGELKFNSVTAGNGAKMVLYSVPSAKFLDNSL